MTAVTRDLPKVPQQPTEITEVLITGEDWTRSGYKQYTCRYCDVIVEVRPENLWYAQTHHFEECHKGQKLVEIHHPRRSTHQPSSPVADIDPPVEELQATPRPMPRQLTKQELIERARIQGYEGDPCRACNQFFLVRNGTCLKCCACGETSGCS